MATGEGVGQEEQDRGGWSDGEEDHARGDKGRIGLNLTRRRLRAAWVGSFVTMLPPISLRPRKLPKLVASKPQGIRGQGGEGLKGEWEKG